MPIFRLFSTFVLILFSFFLNAQHFSSVILSDKPFIAPAMTNRILLDQLEKNKLYSNSKLSEKEFIYWTNYARMFPIQFKDSVLLPFLQIQPSIKGTFSASLIRELCSAPPLPFLEPEEKLFLIAKSHAVDLSTNISKIGHQSTNGLSFSERMKRGGIINCASENISLGATEPIVSLLLLFLDIGLPDLGHRKNLMNPIFSKIGISFQLLKDNQMLIVQDFSCAK